MTTATSRTGLTAAKPKLEGMNDQPIHLRGEQGGDPVLRTVYDEVGGMDAFETLCRRFYDGVQQDAVLWPMYPHDDLEGAIWRLSRFLGQYWGGPSTYSSMRGHPRLRMRHMPFHVNPDARDRWLKHMTAALDTMGWSPMVRAQMDDYFDRAATSMVNTFEPTPE